MLQKKKNLLMLNKFMIIKKKKKIAFVFPGQGSQKVGMGEDLFNNHKVAKEVFELIDEVLGRNLSKLIFKGNQEELTKTFNAQPALLAVSMALVRIIEYETKEKFYNIASIVCGHSLGEYSALCSIHTLSIEDGARLLEIRGNAMQSSVKNLETRMSAILKIDIKKVEKIINEHNNDLVCDIANDNCPGQIVISGNKEKVVFVSDKCREAGAKVLDLNVSAPFHCSLMQPASIIMSKELEKINFLDIKTNFINNVEASFSTEKEKIKNLLVKQITNRVRWRESIELISKNGVQNIVEVGSGKVLSGLNRRMNLSIESQNIENIVDIDSFLTKYF